MAVYVWNGSASPYVGLSRAFCSKVFNYDEVNFGMVSLSSGLTKSFLAWFFIALCPLCHRCYTSASFPTRFQQVPEIITCLWVDSLDTRAGQSRGAFRQNGLAG